MSPRSDPIRTRVVAACGAAGVLCERKELS